MKTWSSSSRWKNIQLSNIHLLNDPQALLNKSKTELLSYPDEKSCLDGFFCLLLKSSSWASGYRAISSRYISSSLHASPSPLPPLLFRTPRSPVCMCYAQPCPTLYNPMDRSPPGSSDRGIILQTILEWVAISYSRGSSWPWDQSHILRVCWTGRWILNHSTT